MNNSFNSEIIVIPNEIYIYFNGLIFIENSVDFYSHFVNILRIVNRRF